MKLSKKIALIFLTTTILTTVIFLICSSFVTKYLFNGEVSRIETISTQYINQFNIERARLEAKNQNYANFIQTSGIVDLNSGAASVMSNIDAQDSNELDYKAILGIDMGELSTLSKPDSSQEAQNDYSSILVKVKEILKNNNNLPINTVIAGSTVPYMVFSSPVSLNGQVVGNFISIEQINNDRILQICQSVGKNIRIVSNIDENDLISKKSDTSEGNLSFKEKENEISSYYKLDGDKFYFEVSEPALVTSKIKSATLVSSVVILVINIIFNVMLLLVVEKLVVKRIAVVNNEINRIRQSKRLEQRVPEDNGKDEISVLTKDINAMFESLQDYNNIILSNEKKYSKLVDGLDNGYALFKLLRDKDGNVKDAFVVEANTSLVKMLKISGEKVIASSFSDLIKRSFKDESLISDILLCVGGSLHKTMQKDVQFGVDNWAYLNVYPIEEDFFALILTDISENRKYAEDMKHLANYDILTNLQNRYSLTNYLQELKKKNQFFNIYFIDLDNFKTINDTLGHNIGDEVLCKTAQILQGIKVEGITVGRLGGDEFIVIMEGNNNRVKVKEIGEMMLKELNTNFTTGDVTYKIEASMGASLFPDDTDDIDALLKYADIAMYKSKKSGGNKIEIFSKSMFEEVVIETQLQEAMDNDEIKVYFQPIYDFETNTITGAEALSRWIKDGKILEPDKFIPVAKKTGDIVAIDNFVLEEACKFCKFKRDEGFEDFKVSINASYKFLKQPDFMAKLDSILEKYHLNPEGLEFEITEDELLDDVKSIVSILERIKRIGVKISLDDFGVGYSAFSYIKILPIDTIKIDRKLLLKVEKDRRTLAIISALIQLAHTLNFSVVAEGIELGEQFDLLKKLKCDKVQGYYVCKPVSVSEFPIRTEI